MTVEELREALDVIAGWEFNTWIAIATDAARERLDQLERGAIVILPDHIGDKSWEWPPWATDALRRHWLNYGRPWSGYLDALRDAQPRGEE